MASNQCSMCEIEAQSICIACQCLFCDNCYYKHRQDLSLKFDNEVVEPHNKLREQINKVKQSNNSHADFLSQINQWEERTIKRVHETAEQARQPVVQLLNQKEDIITEQFGTVEQDIHNRRMNKDFNENYIERLRQKIGQLQPLLEHLIELNNTKLILVENDQIDWNRHISIEKQKQSEWMNLSSYFIFRI
jgi:hypothetical protein